MLIRVEGRRREGRRSPEWVAWQRGKIASALPALARRAALRMADGRGDAPPDAADLATAVATSYLAMRFPDIAWQDEPALRALNERLEARSAFKATNWGAVPPAALDVRF